MNRTSLTLATLLATMLFPVWAHAQDAYPSRPTKVIVPYPAGGVVDVQARALTQGLAAELGQSIVVEARPGANGNIAAEAKPALQYGDGGGGTPQTMATEILKSVAKIQMEPISYKGAPPMMVDLINGAFAVAVIPSSVAYPHIKAGKVRALANTSSKRSAQLPDVPTMAEAGFPEVTVTSWYGLHAPAGTPADVLKKLESAIQSAASRAEVKERLMAAGGESSYLSIGDFTSFLRADTQAWRRINKALGK